MQDSTRKPDDISAEDWADLDSPELTPDQLMQMRPSKRGRGPQKAPTKVATTIRLSPEVIAHFKAEGPGWQSRIDETLLDLVAKS